MMVFLSGLLYVFLLGIQQQNITHEKHAWSTLTSYLIAFAMVLMVKEAAAGDVLEFVLLYGTGSAVGASLSMVAHRWLRRRPRNVIGEVI